MIVISKNVKLTTIFLCLFGFVMEANSSVLLESADTLLGTEVVVSEFYIMDHETDIEVTLTDFEFPEPFETLTLAITSSTALLGSTSGPGTFSFHAEPGTYFAHVVGDAGKMPGTDLEMGAYGLLITEVPIPAAALLFFSGLAVLNFFGLRKSRMS